MSREDRTLDKTYDPQSVEPKWYRWWEEEGFFRADPTSGKPPFAISMPPPNVTGALHMGHALTNTIEDAMVRWRRMSGYETLWLPGTDHAGIATQMVVERELQKEGSNRHELGREKFLERVWAWKEQYGSRIHEQTRVLGSSCDWSRLRFTMDEGLSKAVREVFVRLHEEGLIYRDTRLINWCPSCHTALSDLEVNHEEVRSHLWHIAYPVEGTTDRKLVVATTRPETMLGDTGVAVHPDDPRYRDLVGGQVRLPLVDRLIPIVADPILVDPEFGTGAVKVTPAHDFNDFETGKRHGLEQVSVIDLHGRITENGGGYAGLDRFEARKKVVEDLEAQGLLEKTEDYALSVSVCQRCGTVVEPSLSQQWFVKTEPLARPAIEAVEKGDTVFLPQTWEKTYFHWMRNIQDWCISRQLWWGHRIPAWYCPDGHVTVSRDTPDACAECGSAGLRQDEDVLDTWFSSALWPFSTLGWPEKTEDLKVFYPNAVMETGFDIIFFWVARMMMMGLHFMGEVPFKTVYLHAMVRDEKGQKMSKTRGNVIDPVDIVEKHGADALRFTLASMAGQGRDVKLSLDRVAGYQAFANKIWNAARFALMNLEGYEPDGVAPWEKELQVADRWILSRLDKAVEGTQKAFEEYRFDEAARLTYGFFWHEFCDWYIELSKPALRGELGEGARAAARGTLVHVLDNALRLLHPIMPFVTEEIWQKLPLGDERPASIMVAPFPAPAPKRRDDAGEARMEPLIQAISGVRTIRGESNIPPRAKVRLVVHAEDEAVRRAFEEHQQYLSNLTHAESLEVTGPGPRPPKAAAHVAPGLEVYVPLEGLVDLDEETKRLEKTLQKVEKELAGLEKRLGNEGFVKKAPPEVVEEARVRVAELDENRQRLRENLDHLRGA